MSSHLPRDARHAVELDCRFTAGTRSLAARTRNLSRGGVALMVPSQLPLETPLSLSLSLVFGDDSSSEPLVVPAVVVWCTRVGAEWQLGAKFDGLTREQRSFLDLFIHYLDGGPTVDVAVDKSSSTASAATVPREAAKSSSTASAATVPRETAKASTTASAATVPREAANPKRRS